MALTAFYPKTMRIRNRRFMLRRRKVSRKRDLVRAAVTFLQCLLILLAGASAVLGSMIAYQKLLQCPYLMVKKITIAGCGRYLPDHIMSMAGINRETNLLAIDLKGMCRRLEQSPWIERAQVKRNFPHRLSISILERKPVALINLDGLYLVDDKGTRRSTTPTSCSSTPAPSASRHTTVSMDGSDTCTSSRSATPA